MSLLAQDHRLARRVGAIGLVVLGLAIIFFVFIFDQIEWGRHVRIRIYFHTTGGLQEGAPFVIAGREVGHIETIALSPRDAKTPLDGEEGVAVTVAIDASWARRIVKGGDVFVTSRGALSGKYLEIGPPPGPGPSLQEGDEILGRDPPSLDRVLQRTWDNLTTTARFAAEIRPAMDELSAEVDALRATMQQLAPDVAFRDDLDALVAEARKTYAALGGTDGLDRIGEVRDHGSTMVGQARTTIAELRASADVLGDSLAALKGRLGTKGTEAIDHVQQAIDRVKATIDKIDPLLAQAQELQAQLERGDGSLMKLMHDPEFPEDAKELGKILKRQPWKIIDRPVK
ncbi:MAG TPA: MlaD family protein [Kofleriaceae bacterium]|nr:MlaD family protein [Kofleriaceae bacterium]